MEESAAVIVRRTGARPVLEAQARTWARRFASSATIEPDSRIGPSIVTVDGIDHELDLERLYHGE